MQGKVVGVIVHAKFVYAAAGCCCHYSLSLDHYLVLQCNLQGPCLIQDIITEKISESSPLGGL